MKNNIFVFSPGVKSIRAIENYTDKICENLFINDTYYGNILMCLTEINDLLGRDNTDCNFELYYKTDFKVLTFIIKPIENKTIKRQKTKITLDVSMIQTDLILSLSDNFNVIDNSIVIDFKIGALHKSIYEERLKHLKKYFNKFAGVIERHDHI